MNQPDRTVDIWRDIAYKSELMERFGSREARNSLPVRVEQDPNDNTRRFAEFIRKEVKFVAIEFGPIESSKDGKNIGEHSK
jgi:hypothetical protein